MEVEGEVGGEGEGTLKALGATGFLTEEADPSGTTLVDACNGFNKLIHLEILWNEEHL